MTNRFDEVAQLKALPGRREAIIKRSQSFDSPAPGSEDHGGEAMIIIPPEEVDEFLTNESRTTFSEEQLTFFRWAKKIYRNHRKRGLF